eukprot:COSAG05_NODE_2217_length_3376_cov_61.717410_3_plen_88_part_00
MNELRTSPQFSSRPILRRRKVLTRWWCTAPTAMSEASGQRSADVAASERATSLKPESMAASTSSHTREIAALRAQVSQFHLGALRIC